MMREDREDKLNVTPRMQRMLQQSMQLWLHLEVSTWLICVGFEFDILLYSQNRNSERERERERERTYTTGAEIPENFRFFEERR